MSTDTGERAAARRLRQESSQFPGYFHRAVRVKDMEATRHFYEDVIGLPLVACEVNERDHATGEATSYIHTFFELGDGSFLAFFQFDDHRYPYIQRRPSHNDHHAIHAKSEQTVRGIASRMSELGIWHTVVDDPSCLSCYMLDPDKDVFEVAFVRPGNEDALDQPDARERLDSWLAQHGGMQKVVPRPPLEP